MALFGLSQGAYMQKEGKRESENMDWRLRNKDPPSQLNQDLAVLVAFERRELVPVFAVTRVEVRDIGGGW